MRRLFLVCVTICVLALAGCGGKSTPAPAAPSGQAAATPVASEPARAGQAAQPTAAPAQAAAKPAEATPEPVATEEADLELTDREAALKNLKSYVMNWAMVWKGKKDGQDQTVEWKVTQKYTADPKATHMIVQSTDSLDPDNSSMFEMIQIGTQSYMITDDDGQSKCTSYSSEDNQVTDNWVGPNAFGGVRGGRYVGRETVNGIRTKHYRYDEKATGVNVYTRLNGDIWVAADGGYAVKDVAQWEGNLLVTDEGADGVGQGSWTWELTEVNKPVEITAPPGCESAAAGLPVLPDATERSTFGDMINYKTATKLADVVAFYKDEMPKAGWTAGEEGMSTDEFATLSFTRDEQKATVMVTADGEEISVMINVEK